MLCELLVSWSVCQIFRFTWLLAKKGFIKSYTSVDPKQFKQIQIETCDLVKYIGRFERTALIKKKGVKSPQTPGIAPGFFCRLDPTPSIGGSGSGSVKDLSGGKEPFATSLENNKMWGKLRTIYTPLITSRGPPCIVLVTKGIYVKSQRESTNHRLILVLVICASDYVNPLEGKDYTWYISGIFPANGVFIYYRSHPLRLNQNNPLSLGFFVGIITSSLVVTIYHIQISWEPKVPPPPKATPPINKALLMDY